MGAGVIIGNYRCSLSGQDLNRKWYQCCPSCLCLPCRCHHGCNTAAVHMCTPAWAHLHMLVVCLLVLVHMLVCVHARAWLHAYAYVYVACGMWHAAHGCVRRADPNKKLHPEICQMKVMLQQLCADREV